MIELMFINIGFLELRLLDVIDIILVAVLLYYLYKLLRGSIAFNIFIGLAAIYGLWFLVKILNMTMLSSILGQFIGLGVIALVIVFQPEIRRFLLFIGKGSSFARTSVWKKYVLREETDVSREMNSLKKAVTRLSASSTGALIVLAGTTKLQHFADTGVALNAYISSKLLETIFDKSTPLHDGAVIISESRIVAAGCTLPVSDNQKLPSRVGTRHRAAVGISERTDAIVIIVSEETGRISVAEKGKLTMHVDVNYISENIEKYLKN